MGELAPTTRPDYVNVQPSLSHVEGVRFDFVGRGEHGAEGIVRLNWDDTLRLRDALNTLLANGRTGDADG